MGDRLKGKSAIVTGGAKGIGKAISEVFAQEGAAVAIVDMDETAAEQLVSDITSAGGNAKSFILDVRDRDKVTAMVGEVSSALGGPDILVNNAGIMDRSPFLEMTDEFWDRVLGINLYGTFLCAQVTAQKMVEKKISGKIVNIASNSGIFGGRGRAAYGASKAGVMNLTQTLAIELAEHDILVNALAPGPTKTGPHMPDQPWPSVTARMPLARFGQPVEIARMALFLASDDCSFSTGHLFCADGGFTISGIMEG